MTAPRSGPRKLTKRNRHGPAAESAARPPIDVATGREDDQAEPAAPAPFPIVGIGASAGGLDAFRQLLGALPPDTGMAYVLVQHLHPKNESILAELLSKATGMSVAEVRGDVRVEPNRVYVIPPSEDIVLTGGMLKLVPRSGSGLSHMPIDSFLRTLAEERGSQGIGVILSGMASDGTLGLAAIKAEGGIAFVQDPASAKFPAMPHSAIAAGCVDFVLTPEQIAAELTRLGRHPYLAAAEASTPPEGRPAGGEEDEAAAALAAILSLLKKATGADFAAYKKATLLRRIGRRMAVNRTATLADYARRLGTDTDEADALYQDCLISVTSFFRDPDVFKALRDKVLPRLFERRPADGPLRVWVAGCATGEEAYSIAICLLEHADRFPGSPAFQIFATDLSEGALKTARAGVYLENIVQNVSPERLHRFFSKVDGRYQINKGIREACVFARHDLTRDPPFSRMGLISCRNVLIYLEPQLQERVLASFHYALDPSGCLLLGPAEGVGPASGLFSRLDERRRIFKRRATPSPPQFHFASGASAAGRAAAPVVLTPKAAARSEVPREADRMLLARYGPPGVVVDEALNIIEFRGDTDAFLEHAHGQASLNLIQMARRGFLVELRQAIQEAREKGAPSRKEGLQIRHRGRLHKVSLEVIPIKGRATTERCLLILFETEREGARTGTASPLAARPAAETRDATIAQLEQKLAETSQYLHTVLREHDTALEELQSTNEEALSSNEELQSVNEELQTAQQEIQSANEELATLNHELQDRNRQLGQLNDDLLNLLGSVNIPIVMVGKDVRLRRFTPAAESLFSLMAADVGRPLGDVRSYLDVPDLEGEVRAVIESVKVSEREVQDRDGRTYVMRIWPYMTREDRIDGAVVVLMDVDALRRGADVAQRAAERANAIVATVREPLLILDADLKVEQANPAFYQTFQVQAADTLGRPLLELSGGQWNRPELRSALAEVLANDTTLEDFELEVELPSVGRRTTVLNGRRLPRESGGTERILLAIADRTEIKRAQLSREALLALEHAARQRAEAADHLKDQFVATVSHELRGPLTAIVGWVHILSESGLSLDEATLAKGLATISRSVAAQDRLISDLLDHSRVVTGSLQLARRPLALFPVAEAALESVRAAAEAKDIELELAGDRAASVILGDPDRMQQVLWNLFFNAVKFTPRHGRIQIWMGRVGTQVHLTVSDTGQGIRKDFLPHVFERFRQDGTPVSGQVGLGLGLTLVRELVELHGGTVRADSPGPGQGATFTLVFPIPALLLYAPGGEAKVGTEPEPMGARRIQLEVDRTVLAGLSVLVVDDEADVRASLTSLLERHGARVRATAAASDALEALTEEVPDVLVSDIGLPGEDGCALMRKLRLFPAEQGGSVPALAVSSFAREEDRQKSLSAGFQFHLCKPVPPAELVAHVARLAGRTISN